MLYNPRRANSDNCKSIDSFVASVIEILNGQVYQSGCLLDEYVQDVGWGKMLRTRFLASMIDPGAVSERILKLSAAIELIHSSSLLHDDVVDQSSVRRGKLTLWKQTSVSKAVLAGDLLLSKALKLVVQNSDLIEHFLDAIETMASSESEQMYNNSDVLIINQYMNHIGKKTGKLFALCMRCVPTDCLITSDLLSDIGSNLGIVYQIVDDLLDEFGDVQITGKNQFVDRVNNSITITHCQNSLIEGQNLIKQILDKSFSKLKHLTNYHDGLQYYITNYFLPTIKSTGLKLEETIFNSI